MFVFLDLFKSTVLPGSFFCFLDCLFIMDYSYLHMLYLSSMYFCIYTTTKQFYLHVRIPGQALCGQLNLLCVWRLGPPPPTHSSSNGGLRQLRWAGPGLRQLRWRQRVSLSSARQLCCVRQTQTPAGPLPCFPLLSAPSLGAGRPGPGARPALRLLSRTGRSEGRPGTAAGKYRGPGAIRLTISRGLAKQTDPCGGDRPGAR